MAGELESGTIWWDLSRPAASSPHGPLKSRANSALLTVSPARPVGWEPPHRLLHSLPGLSHFYLQKLILGLKKLYYSQ